LLKLNAAFQYVTYIPIAALSYVFSMLIRHPTDVIVSFTV